MNVVHNQIQQDRIFETVNELIESGLTIQFSAFIGKKDGKQLYSCRVTEFTPGEGSREMAKAYGEDLVTAFNKAYSLLNQL